MTNKAETIKAFEKWINATEYDDFDIVETYIPSWKSVPDFFKVFTGKR